MAQELNFTVNSLVGELLSSCHLVPLPFVWVASLGDSLSLSCVDTDLCSLSIQAFLFLFL